MTTSRGFYFAYAYGYRRRPHAPWRTTRATNFRIGRPRRAARFAFGPRRRLL